MVSQMGFSRKLGQVAWTSSGGNQFLGAQMAQPSDCSGETQDLIDAEVKVRACVRAGLRWGGVPVPRHQPGQLRQDFIGSEVEVRACVVKGLGFRVSGCVAPPSS